MTLLVRRAALLVALLAGLSLLAPSTAVLAPSGASLSAVAAGAPSTEAPAPDRAWSPGAVATALPAAAADDLLAAPVPALAQHLRVQPVVRPPSDGRAAGGPSTDRERGPPVPAGT